MVFAWFYFISFHFFFLKWNERRRLKWNVEKIVIILSRQDVEDRRLVSFSLLIFFLSFFISPLYRFFRFSMSRKWDSFFLFFSFSSIIFFLFASIWRCYHRKFVINDEEWWLYCRLLYRNHKNANVDWWKGSQSKMAFAHDWILLFGFFFFFFISIIYYFEWNDEVKRNENHWRWNEMKREVKYREWKTNP